MLILYLTLCFATIILYKQYAVYEIRLYTLHISVYYYISVYKCTYDFAQYNTLYIRQLICHHFIHCLSGSGDDCTQNHCTVLAQTNQALCDVLCSLMNTINVIENGGAGNSLKMYAQLCFLHKAAPLRRQIQRTSSFNAQSKTPGTTAVITVLTYRFVD